MSENPQKYKKISTTILSKSSCWFGLSVRSLRRNSEARASKTLYVKHTTRIVDGSKKQNACLTQKMNVEMWKTKRRLLRISFFWSEWQDLNLRPLPPQGSALPTAPHPDFYEKYAWSFKKPNILYHLLREKSRVLDKKMKMFEQNLYWCNENAFFVQKPCGVWSFLSRGKSESKIFHSFLEI